MNHHLILFNQMIGVLQRFYPNLPIPLLVQLREYLHFIDHNTGTIILHYKEVQKVAWFLGAGTCAEITIDPFTKNEITTFFWSENDFLFTTPGFFSQQPSESYIQTLEPCSFAFMTFENFLKLKQQFAETEILSEKIRDYYKTLNSQRIIENKRKSLDRINGLQLVHQNLFELCTRKQLASYLNMTPDTLKRGMEKLNIHLKKRRKK